jgi:hypothetical protein
MRGERHPDPCIQTLYSYSLAFTCRGLSQEPRKDAGRGESAGQNDIVERLEEAEGTIRLMFPGIDTVMEHCSQEPQIVERETAFLEAGGVHHPGPAPQCPHAPVETTCSTASWNRPMAKPVKFPKKLRVKLERITAEREAREIGIEADTDFDPFRTFYRSFHQRGSIHMMHTRIDDVLYRLETHMHMEPQNAVK